VAPRHLELLGLSPERVSARIDFLEAYAKTVQAEIANTLRSAPDQTGRMSSSREFDDHWVRMADTATALRQAAQWSLFLDPGRARGLLRQAGSLYLDLGQGFGLFLLAAGHGW
jgi:hypothetical protein